MLVKLYELTKLMILPKVNSLKLFCFYALMSLSVKVARSKFYLFMVVVLNLFLAKWVLTLVFFFSKNYIVIVVLLP